MKAIGLTGGIGMGKSTAERILRSRGFLLVDTDQLARDLVQPGQPALLEIAGSFGNGVIRMDGSLDRDALARVVFSDAAARARLEAILHPGIREAWLARFEESKRGGATIAFVVIPLLFETGADKELDAVICVACSAQTQRLRLGERHWSETELNQRLAAQWPIQKKADASDYLIWNEAGLEVLKDQLVRVVGSLTDGVSLRR